MIVAFAGRRIDARNAKERRFPLEMEKIVYRVIRDFFQVNNVRVLVSSAACGADLLAQKAAQELKVEQQIIIPFERGNFKETSVTDRPGDWGELFDDICDEVERKGNLIVLEGFEDDDDDAYSAVTTAILSHAESLKRKPDKEKLLAVIAWEGCAKQKDDETAAFAAKARSRSIEVAEILTSI